jgi:iron complex transport system substrate-binding protein
MCRERKVKEGKLPLVPASCTETGVSDLHSRNAGFFWGAARLSCAPLVIAGTVFFLLFRSDASAVEAAATTSNRIVSLVPAVTETLFALGIGPRVVGVSTYCDYPPETKTLPKVGSFTEPVAETIVALKPDLVLTSPSPGNETSVRAIERTGIRVAVIQSEGGLREARSAILDVARAVGASEAGAALVARIDARLGAVKAAAAGLARPTAAVVVGREPLVLAGPGSYLGELLVLAGGANIADALGGRWPRVGMEFLVASRVEVLVDLSVGMGEAPDDEDAAAAWASMPSLPAVASGRVVRDSDALMLRPGPRLADAAEALFRALHPGAALPSPVATPPNASPSKDGNAAPAVVPAAPGQAN